MEPLNIPKKKEAPVSFDIPQEVGHRYKAAVKTHVPSMTLKEYTVQVLTREADMLEGNNGGNRPTTPQETPEQKHTRLETEFLRLDARAIEIEHQIKRGLGSERGSDQRWKSMLSILTDESSVGLKPDYSNLESCYSKMLENCRKWRFSENVLMEFISWLRLLRRRLALETQLKEIIFGASAKAEEPKATQVQQETKPVLFQVSEKSGEDDHSGTEKTEDNSSEEGDEKDEEDDGDFYEDEEF